ncbi:MAG: hypothetical protein ACE5KP_05860 [Dehalococcoidales bacterium]
MTEQKVLTVVQLFAIVILTAMMGEIFSATGIKVFQIYQESTGEIFDFFLRLIAHWVRMLGG